MKQQEIVIDKMAYETKPERGFVAKAFYLKNPVGDALIEIWKDGEKFRWFLFPAYKIYNISAHLHDIADQEVSSGFSTKVRHSQSLEHNRFSS